MQEIQNKESSMKSKGIQNTQEYMTQIIEKIKQRQFVEKP